MGDVARLLAVMTVVLAIGGCERREPAVVDTSLCAIVSAPASFDGRTVRIRSRLESDATHSTVLSDAACRGIGIGVTSADDEENPRLRELTDAISARKGGRPGTLDKEITGTFTGVFEWHESERWPRRIRLLDVTHLEIKPRADSPFAALSFVRRLTTELYVYPLGLANPRLRIDRDSPYGFVVHVLERAEWAPAELLTVNVVWVRGHLQYVSASGKALDGPAPTREVLEYRRAAAVRILQSLGGYSTDGKERRATRAGSVELRFTHPDPPAHLSPGATAVFEQRSGILTMFGTPAVSPGV